MADIWLCAFTDVLRRQHLQTNSMVFSHPSHGSKEPWVKWDQHRTNPFASARGEKSAMQPFVKILWPLVNDALRCFATFLEVTKRRRREGAPLVYWTDNLERNWWLKVDVYRLLAKWHELLQQYSTSLQSVCGLVARAIRKHSVHPLDTTSVIRSRPGSAPLLWRRISCPLQRQNLTVGGLSAAGRFSEQAGRVMR